MESAVYTPPQPPWRDMNMIDFILPGLSIRASMDTARAQRDFASL